MDTPEQGKEFCQKCSCLPCQLGSFWKERICSCWNILFMTGLLWQKNRTPTMFISSTWIFRNMICKLKFRLAFETGLSFFIQTIDKYRWTSRLCKLLTDFLPLSLNSLVRLSVAGCKTFTWKKKRGKKITELLCYVLSYEKWHLRLWFWWVHYIEPYCASVIELAYITKHQLFIVLTGCFHTRGKAAIRIKNAHLIW